jgi:diadenosine tetraphosphate (Ap4A) HIT family hydrolase
MTEVAANATISRFGYPATLVSESEHWVVLIRPDQPTLGSLVLAAKSDATAFADLSPAAFGDLGEMIARLERMLRATVAPDKINYLMLMMADPHVHFHVLPRYAGERSFQDMRKDDEGWPKVPLLTPALKLDAGQIQALAEWMAGAAA